MKEINGFPGYFITEEGQVWSNYSNKFLHPTSNSRGYLTVTLTGHKTRTIHRLVAEAFIPNPNNLPYVNHKDENKTNNSVTNLEWCTAQYNRNYGQAPKKYAIKRGFPVLCIETQQIYYSIREAGRQTGIDFSSIYKVCCGKQNTAGNYHWQYVEQAT